MLVIKRIVPLSAAKMAGLIYALIALPFAILVWVVSLVGLNYSGLSDSPFLPFSPRIIQTGGAVAVLVFPILYGAFCSVLTLFGAWLYNGVAGIVGGVSVEVQTDGAPDATA